jgi:hypothetical protein
MAQEETGIQRAVIKGGEVRIQNGGERQRADGHANFSFVAKKEPVVLGIHHAPSYLLSFHTRSDFVRTKDVG